jgi:hypothetical protein
MVRAFIQLKRSRRRIRPGRVYALLCLLFFVLCQPAGAQRATRGRQAGGGGAASTRRVFFRGPLTRVSLVAAAITFSLAGGLFFVIPRVRQAALPLRAQLGRMVTGFADRVDLGSFGDIETDHSVVMRVYLTDERVDPVALPELRWRGVAFDQFDGRAWSSTVAPRRYLRLCKSGC